MFMDLGEERAARIEAQRRMLEAVIMADMDNAAVKRLSRLPGRSRRWCWTNSRWRPLWG